MAMILLEAANRILKETVLGPLTDKKDPMDTRLCDFDDVTYRVAVSPDVKNIMTVSMSLPSYTEIKEHGGEEALKKAFGDAVVEAQPSFDITLSFDIEAARSQAEAEALANKIAMIRSIVVGGVYDKFLCAANEAKNTASNFKFNIRADTVVYFIPGDGRVTIVYDVDFQDRVDQAVAKVFLQEFQDGRRHVPAAPSVSFNVNPPLELKQFGITEPHGSLGFVSFGILPSHVKTPELRERVAQTMLSFRNYMQYHIKCSKAYFHSRMRARVVSLLQVLNRAKAEVPEDQRVKKTITGKAFLRK